MFVDIDADDFRIDSDRNIDDHRDRRHRISVPHDNVHVNRECFRWTSSEHHGDSGDTAKRSGKYEFRNGTGGDGHGTLNVSTAASFVVAACGVPVAKHGNRNMSSKSGAADVLEALHIRIDLSPQAASTCIEETGLCFLFAPIYHPAMKHVAPVRKDLGFRTVFNLLGPVCNPARVRRQLLGVFTERWVEPLARVLQIVEPYANGMLLGSSESSPLRPLTRPECRGAIGCDCPGR